MAFDDLRRALAAIGFVPATTRAAGSQVSAPDARWDRLLYGIHNVEDFLAAVVPAHS